MRVSVIIPVGAVDEDLQLQLDALASQSFIEPWELVLSLNTDSPAARSDLERLLGRTPELSAKIVDSSSTRSASYARNKGAEEAEGELLLFCDGDDIAHKDWIDSLVDALEIDGAVGGFLDEQLLAITGQEHWRPPATPDGLPTFLGVPFLVTANMGIRRELFEKVGGFELGLVRCEDIAFSWDLIELGVDLAYCEGAVIYYRHRRGLKSMMHQHYLYGRGLSQVLARRGVPGDDSNSGLGALKPNSQPVAKKTWVYFLRRGSLAVGRVVGLVQERA